MPMLGVGVGVPFSYGLKYGVWGLVLDLTVFLVDETADTIVDETGDEILVAEPV